MSLKINRTLPWNANAAGIITGQCQDEDSDAPFIADVCDSPLDYTRFEKAKAEFIIRAANAHAPLVRALEGIGAVLPHNLMSTATDAQRATVCKRILDAYNLYAAPVLDRLKAGEQ